MILPREAVQYENIDDQGPILEELLHSKGWGNEGLKGWASKGDIGVSKA